MREFLQVLLLVTQLLAFLASFSCGPLFSSVLHDASNRQASNARTIVLASRMPCVERSAEAQR